MNAGKGGERPNEQQVWLLRGGIVAVALVLALVAWIATRDDEAEPQVESAARIVDESELAETVTALGQPIYWAGPVEGTELELEELESGGVQLRYVPEGEDEADPAGVLTVGSYPLADPVGALESFGREPGASVRRAEDGTQVYLSEGSNSVYFADPEGGVQVEVYDPSAEKALSLALAGEVEPVE